MSPLREGPGLVEQHGVDGAHALEGQPVLDQDAGAGRQGGGQADDQGDGQPEGVGAGDHQHGDRPHHGVVGLAQRGPRREGQDAGTGGHLEQQGGEPVGQCLGTRPAGLGLGHQALDPGQGGISSHGPHPDPDGGVGGHGPGHDGVTGALGNGTGLTGDHRLVELGLPLDDFAVGGHPTSRPHQHDVALGELIEAHHLNDLVGAQRSASSGSSSASAASAPRAWPMAFISCQWPSSMMVISAASPHQKPRSNRPKLVAADSARRRR